MRIRRAVSSEHCVLEVLLPEAYAPFLSQLSSNDAEGFRSGIIASVQKYAKSGTWFVAEHEGEVVGWVAYFPPHSTNHPLFQGNLSHIQLLGVVPASTRRGVGQELMQHCLNETNADGSEGMALKTSELMTPARRLYERMGFRVAQILPPVLVRLAFLYFRGVGRHGQT